MTKRQEATALRKAARHYEKYWSPYGSGSAYYPCFAVQKFDPDVGSYSIHGTLANRFIRSQCPGKTEPRVQFTDAVASNRFLCRVNIDIESGRDHCVLALCFAAAMAETGDL